MTTKADALKAERASVASLDTTEEVKIALTGRIDRELRKLANRRVAARERRALLFEVNGHHGAA